MEIVKLLREKEVAQLTGLSLSTLRKNRLNKKGFPYCKIGKSIRYPVQDLILYFEKRKVEFDEHQANE